MISLSNLIPPEKIDWDLVPFDFQLPDLEAALDEFLRAQHDALEG